jgi:GT2 family glycosyltransferase
VTLGISVVIVFYRGLEDLRRCLLALENQTLRAEQVVVVDNSPAGECSSIKSNDELLVLRPERNLGFAAGNNRAVKKAKAELVLTLNADAFPTPNCLEELSKAAAAHPECAAFGCVQFQAEDERFLDGFGDVYHFSGLMWRRGYGRLASLYKIADRPISSPCGAAALYRKKVFEELGGFDEDFFCYCEDVDLGLRVWSQGWTCRLVANAIVAHKGSGSTGSHSDFSVYHGHRNLVWVFVKNMPGIWFYLCFPWLILVYAYIYRSVSKRGQGEIMRKAAQDALRGLNRCWRKRRQIGVNRQIATLTAPKFLDFSMPPEVWRPVLMRRLMRVTTSIKKKLTTKRLPR